LRPKELIELAAGAVTEEERETAFALLRKSDWDGAEEASPAALRGALTLLAEQNALGAVPGQIVRLALAGMDEAEDPVAEASKAAVILGAAPAGTADALPRSVLGNLLRELRNGPARETGLRVEELFPDGLCLQRYFFHNDDDGVESFDSFMNAYAGDPDWTVERTADLVHWTGKAAGRRIEIYANIPVDLQAPANFPSAPAVQKRQDIVTRALRERRMAPVVLVHRGHDHHFEETRKYLRGDARLVFLGSCRGMANVEDVVTRCRRAQMIATRGIGATAVNDTFLRALNRRLLVEKEVLDWDAFWTAMQPVLGSNGHFLDYVRPNHNEAARFLGAWYRQALSAQ
jgi:hypothetical protein